MHTPSYLLTSYVVIEILGCLQLLLMTNIRELYKNCIAKLQQFIYTIGVTKRIQIMSEYIDIRPGDILLDVGGNTGKITEAYSNNCKEVVVLEPKGSIVISVDCQLMWISSSCDNSTYSDWLL